MAKYTFPEPVAVQSYDLDGTVHAFSCAAGEVDLGPDDIALLERLAPGVATLVVVAPAAPVVVPTSAPVVTLAPAPAAPSEV